MGLNMQKTNHQERKHAKLSASGSAQWLNCPGSVKAQEAYPESQSSFFADEGTLAHELADLCLKKRISADFYVGQRIGKLKISVASFSPDHELQKDMCEYVQEYLDYVLSHETHKTTTYTEERVDFSNIVPEGFGTMDSAVYDPETKTCHIFDLKYGKGVAVDAFENTQGQMYALGFLNELSFLEDIEHFRIHICQPRIKNFSYWDISVKDLKKFGAWATERANLALSDNAPRVPGVKQCQWCSAKGDCKALAKFTQDMIMCEFEELEKGHEDKLSDEDKKKILDSKSMIINFLSAVEDSVYLKLVEGGEFNGYKLVEGRSTRQFTDDAEQFIVAKLGEEAHKKSLIGITEAEKKLGRDDMDKITIKPVGKLTLVPDTDKRQAVIMDNVANMLED